MKRLALVLATAFFAACTSAFPPGLVEEGKLAPEPPSLSGLTLEERVGQLFVVAGHGVFMNEESPAFRSLARHVTENHVGGVIWFRSNVYETAFLNVRLQSLAKVPLLVSADLEAGTGMRFDDVTWGPWAMALGATGDPALAEKRARATAMEARALGVNQVYAPVADVNVNPDNPVINVRSFGEDPSEVARFIRAEVKGLQEGGVLATLKHFPGHGDTNVDSHRALPVLRVGRARLDAVELVPFREGIAAGAGSVMVAHLAVPALDPTPAPPRLDAPNEKYPVDPVEVEKAGTVPATLSAPIVTDLLRKELGFDGLVVTDSMEMGGVVSHFGAGEAAVRAILAGADQVLMSPEPDAAIRAVLEAVRSGRIPKGRIDESVRRILRAKERLGLHSAGAPSLRTIAKTVGSPEHEAIEEEIARRSLTLVREAPGALPLRPGATLALVVVSDEATLNGPAGTLTAGLAGRAAAAGRPAPKVARLDPRSTPEEVKGAVESARGADAVLLALFVRARSGAGRIAVPEPAKGAVSALLALGKPVVAVSFGSPYLLRELPDLSTYVCAYGTQDVVQAAALRALFGEAGLEGRLPVTLPGLAPRGTGIRKGP